MSFVCSDTTKQQGAGPAAASLCAKFPTLPESCPFSWYFCPPPFPIFGANLLREPPASRYFASAAHPFSLFPCVLVIINFSARTFLARASRSFCHRFCFSFCPSSSGPSFEHRPRQRIGFPSVDKISSSCRSTAEGTERGPTRSHTHAHTHALAAQLTKKERSHATPHRAWRRSSKAPSRHNHPPPEAKRSRRFFPFSSICPVFPFFTRSPLLSARQPTAKP